MSNPSGSQPWRPKHQLRGAQGGQGGGAGGANSGSTMGSPTGSTNSGSGAGGRPGFETDVQLAHRSHKHPHGQHGFQKFQDPGNSGGGAIPIPASKAMQAQTQQQAAAQAASQQAAPQFNLEDANDAFGNIRESAFCENATDWQAVEDSGVSHKRVHPNVASFVKMCVAATQ